MVNDLFNDKDFFASPPSQYVVGGKVMRAEKLDAYTVKLILAAPYLRLPAVLATPLGQHLTLYAKHDCAQFTPKYNPDIAKLFAESHQPSWPALRQQPQPQDHQRRADHRAGGDRRPARFPGAPDPAKPERHRGEIVEIGEADEICARLRMAYTRQLLAAMPEADPEQRFLLGAP